MDESDLLRDKVANILHNFVWYIYMYMYIYIYIYVYIYIYIYMYIYIYKLRTKSTEALRDFYLAQSRVKGGTHKMTT